jgi:hypothetical protein
VLQIAIARNLLELLRFQLCDVAGGIPWIHMDRRSLSQLPGVVRGEAAAHNGDDRSRTAPLLCEMPLTHAPANSGGSEIEAAGAERVCAGCAPADLAPNTPRIYRVSSSDNAGRVTEVRKHAWDRRACRDWLALLARARPGSNVCLAPWQSHIDAIRSAARHFSSAPPHESEHAAAQRGTGLRHDTIGQTTTRLAATSAFMCASMRSASG